MKFYKISLIIFLISTFLELFANPQFGNQVDLGLIENDEIDEASGIVASRKNNNVFWLHNDSGNENVIYAINSSGNNLGIYTISGITNRDWEDITIGPGPDPDEDYIYLGDIGDNNLQYEEKYIYRFIEPDVSEFQDPVFDVISNVETITFQYPENILYDAETLMSDPVTGDLYVVTKRYGGNVDYVFRAAYPQSTETTITLEEVAQLTIPDFLGYGATGGDISSSGLEILIKTYSDVYYWSRKLDDNLWEAFDDEPLMEPYSQEPQGEAICWKADAMGYYTVSEEYMEVPAHLYLYPRIDNFISLSQLPNSLYQPSETFRIEWSPSDLYCEMYYSSSPGGEDLNNYVPLGLNGIGSIQSTPGNVGLGIGVYYCVLHNPEYNYTSVEFQLIVESPQAVTMMTPINGSVITNTTPIFSWEANPGVPYYFLVLSDHPFTVEEDEDGHPIVIGLQPIWQIITPNTSALYGEQDPSGYFTNNAPPLVPGITYNWLVANNYGNDPLFTSKIVSSPFGFEFSSEQTIDSPILILPENNATILGDDLINFQWSSVPGAMNYRIFLYEIREENGSEGYYPIWNQITTENHINFNAENILINAEYAWKVFASDENDVSSVSTDFRFTYSTIIGTLRLYVRNIDGSPVGYANVELNPLDGTQDIVLFVIGPDGNETKVITPGDYLLSCSKDGYETIDTLITITQDNFPDSPDGDTVLWLYMEYSPSNFYGSVVDEEGYLIENVTVYAENENGEIRSVTSSNGNYTIGVTQGLWTITADKEEYTLSEPIVSNIIAGENVPLPDLVMILNEKDVTGFVKNPSGIPISRATVTAVKNNIIRIKMTNDSGYYKFKGLDFGEWTISVSKNGYSSPDPVEVSVSQASPETIILDDLILTPYASIVIGNVNNSIVGLEGVTITATPIFGLPTSTTTDYYGNYTLNLSAGDYIITADLLGYTSQNTYEVSLDIAETMEGTDFLLLPDNLKIFGYVTDENSFPLEHAIVTATLLNSAGFRETFVDSTDQNGYYDIKINLIGNYEIIASLENYYDSEPAYVELTVEQTSIQQDLVLTHVPIYASLHGKVVIFDETLGQNVPPTNAVLTLRNQAGFSQQVEIEAPDSLFEFNDFIIPGIFSLEVAATYLDQQYFDLIPQIEINEEGTYYQNFSFTYTENAVNLSGYIFMNDNEILPLSSAEIVLKDSLMMPLDTTYTNTEGFYQFNNLTENRYSLSIEAEYDNEHFSGEISDIEWTGSNIVVDDYIFTFILCSVDFFISQDDDIPLSEAIVRISGNNTEDILLVTNGEGYCSVNNALHTGVYSVMISKENGNFGKIIPALPYELRLDSLAYYIQEKQLPLQFDETQISESVPCCNSKIIYLKKPLSYQSPVIMNYTDVNGESHEIQMINDDSVFTAAIPPQLSSGTVSFWFHSYSNELDMTFDNENSPFSFTVYSEGIPDENLSVIIPHQPVFVYTQQAIFETHIFDDYGNNLDALIDSFGTVQWILDSNIGTIENFAEEKRKVKFIATSEVNGSIEGTLSASITLENNSITLNENIQIKDMYLAELVITGESDEVENSDQISLTVSAFSDSGTTLTIPLEFEQVPEFMGNIQMTNNILTYFPNRNYIGQFDINVWAFDPRTNNKISASQTMTVFKNINAETDYDTLSTGEGCDLLIYPQMLDTLQIQQAKLYLKSVQAAPFKQYSVKNEINGKVFNLNSNRIQQFFLTMPGLKFNTENIPEHDNIYIAYWDNNSLEWIEAEDNFYQENELLISQVPYISSDYGVVSNSSPLGIYDLKLRPNPFTPYDQIGDNMGLQIEFRLSSNRSRYPKITAEIYTINGTLVRTIAKNLPMLKGNYRAGEAESLYWDGKTDEGRIARNGRYVIRLIAEDTKNRKELLKTIVLIK